MADRKAVGRQWQLMAYFVEKLGWAPPIERLAGGQRL